MSRLLGLSRRIMPGHNCIGTLPLPAPEKTRPRSLPVPSRGVPTGVRPPSPGGKIGLIVGGPIPGHFAPTGALSPDPRCKRPKHRYNPQVVCLILFSVKHENLQPPGAKMEAPPRREMSEVDFFLPPPRPSFQSATNAFLQGILRRLAFGQASPPKTRPWASFWLALWLAQLPANP